MKPRIESPRRMDLPHLTSSGMHVAQDVGVAAAPPEAGARLPERYGSPQLELLVVDTEYAFIAWEITPEQIAHSRARLSEEQWHTRRLLLVLRDANTDEEVQHAELYGEVGRWFIHLARCGFPLVAELGWSCGRHFELLYRAGPVAVPRDFMVEPLSYDELYVQYGKAPDGRLQLKRLSHSPDAPWPQITLPQPGLLDEHEIEPRQGTKGVQSWTLGSGAGQRTLVLIPGGRAEVSSPGVSSGTSGHPSPPTSSSSPDRHDVFIPDPDGTARTPGGSTPIVPPATGPIASAAGSRAMDPGSYNTLNTPVLDDNVPASPEPSRTVKQRKRRETGEKGSGTGGKGK